MGDAKQPAGAGKGRAAATAPAVGSPRPRAGMEPAAGIRCDFCGELVESVRRIALDHDYDRLQTPHRELYACARCSERKERSRLGLDR